MHGSQTVGLQQPRPRLRQGVSPRSPTWVVGAKYLGHILLVSQVISREVRLDMEELGHDLAPVCDDAGNTGGWL